MPKQSRRSRVVVAAAVLGAAAWFILRSSEPRYHGRSLGDWLADCTDYGDNSTEWRAAEDALNHIGTNAVPSLLLMLRARDSAFKLRLEHWLGHQHFFEMDLTMADAWHLRAQSGFQHLGSSARAAVPELVSILNENISPTSQSATAASLGYIGPGADQAVALLVHTTAAADWSLRYRSVYALGSIHTQPEVVIPVLIHAMHDSSFLVRGGAAMGCGDYGDRGSVAVPALVECLGDNNYFVRQQTAYALAEIHCQPDLAIPALIRCLDVKDDALRRGVVQALEQFGPDARPAIPALLELTNDRRVGRAAVRALAKIDLQSVTNASSR